MHTEGIEERADDDDGSQWFIRSECRGCGFKEIGRASCRERVFLTV